MEKISDVSGVVLAGGMSSRYGKNKALVDFHGIPLIERVLGVMLHIFRHVIIITNTPDEYSYLKLPMYQDTIKGLGPLGGIFTGLQAIPNSGFFVACDMPFLNQGLIQHMVEIRAGFDLVVPRINGYMEALHSLYGKECEEKIKNLINSGVYQVFRFFNEVSVRYVDENEVRMFDPDLKSFLNINSPGALNDLDNLY